MESNLLEIAGILTKRFNRWWTGSKPFVPLFRRRDFLYVKDRLESQKVVVLTGPRQVGKTTLVKQIISDLIESGVPPKHILFVQLDDFRIRDISDSPLRDVLKAYETHIIGESLDSAEGVYIFLDEVQKAENWADIVKTYHDSNKNLHFICTGSASFKITQKGSETLPGRHHPFTMFPLKFADAAVAANPGILDAEKVRNWSYSLREALISAWESGKPDVFENAAGKFMLETQHVPFQRFFNQYLLKGGYPEVVLTSDTQKCQDLFRSYANDVILKDMMPWFHIRDFQSAEHLLFLLASNSGNEVGYKQFTDRIRGSNYITLHKYISYYELLDIVSLVPRYSGSASGSKKNEKVYFNDVGFRNAMMGLENPEPSDMGKIAETVLHDHLQRLSFKMNDSLKRQIFYYKTSWAEIDFILHSTKTGKNLPMECKYSGGLTASQCRTLGSIANENRTFGIATTQNDLRLYQNILEVPLWVICFLA